MLILLPSALASDTCMFEVTADDVPPNIVILLDNGAQMQYALWHGSYDHSIDHEPTPIGYAVDGLDNDGDGTVDEPDEDDVVLKPDNPNNINKDPGSGFFWKNGYSIVQKSTFYYLVAILDDMQVDPIREGIKATTSDPAAGTATFAINGKTLTLPCEASSALDGDNIKDNAGYYRYDANYLNWLFFASGVDSYAQVANGPHDGTDLPHRSRFYEAKKALMTVAKMAANKASFGIYNFANDEGASNVQPLGMVVDTVAAQPANNVLDPNYINNINNMGTVVYSPLAEGLATVGGYYDSPSSGVVSEYCQKNFVIVVSSGVPSEDQTRANQYLPDTLIDFDNDNGTLGEGNIQADANTYTIPVNHNGATWLDDVAHYLYNNDIVGYRKGFQNVHTYTVGFMSSHESDLFLINTSNNGNGNTGLYNTADPEYGKYHYKAESPAALAARLLAALNSILSQTSTFTAPVVPVTRTTSGNKIYLAFFKPGEGVFWDGNIVKFGISATHAIVDVNGNAATYPNGSMIPDAIPYWSTKDWADTAKGNGIHNTSRSIYTYLGWSKTLGDATNRFDTANADITQALLGNPTVALADIIDYVRGADVMDEDGDGNTAENRWIITGDVLHSEPAVVQYLYPDDSARTMVYFAANDGMLHAVHDVDDPDVDTENDETTYGTEAWGFIPPDQLPRLKNFLEGVSHIDYVDSSPKVYFQDVDGDGYLDTGDGDKMILVCGERKGGNSYFALDITDPMAPKYLWRVAGTSDQDFGSLVLHPYYVEGGGSFQDGDILRLWHYNGVDRYEWTDNAIVSGAETTNADGKKVIGFINRTIPFTKYRWVSNCTMAEWDAWIASGHVNGTFAWAQIDHIASINPDYVIPELGESWSEPQFGRVKTYSSDTTGTPVVFLGGGYSADSTLGNCVVAIRLLTGQLLRLFKNNGGSITAMDYSIPSTVKVIDEDNNGFIDKLYVGDLGGQMWRIGQFAYDENSNALTFPDANENIYSWTAHPIFQAPTYVIDSVTYTRKFFYPPSVVLEWNFDLVSMGTGDREDACAVPAEPDLICAVRDKHTSDTWTVDDLVDVTDPAATPPELNYACRDVDADTYCDEGWYIRLVDASGNASGEKVLASNTVFYKTLYITTFLPNNEACVPGGYGRIYAMDYLTGQAKLFLVTDANGDGLPDLSRFITIGGGIPSKPVMVLTGTGQKMFISVGSTNPEDNSQSVEAGVIAIDPLAPPINFFYLWWRDINS